MAGQSAGWREQADGVSDEQRSDAVRLAAGAERGRGRSLSRIPDTSPVVLVSAEQ